MNVPWPSIWPLVRSWFTPAVLFVLLNLVIGTIALTSKSLLSHRRPDEPAGNGHAIFRTASSAIHRLRSLSLYSLHSGDFTLDSPPAATAVHHESDETEDPSTDSKVSEKEDEHMFCRSQSETRLPAETEAASASLKKSASERLATGLFEEKKAERQPAKAVIEEDVEHEVDARADDFINRFRQQLHLQRLDSLLRYKEMLSRGK